MKVSSREIVLLLSTAAVGLFGVTAILARPRIDEWRDLRKTQRQVQDSIERNQRLIHARGESEAAYNELRKQFPPVENVDEITVHWLSLIEGMAEKRGLKLLSHRVGQERGEGDLSEITIDCTKWEGTTEALVRFLFDLQQQDAMVDVRYLRVKPKDKSVRTGRFVLSCAYMRKE